MKSDIHFVFNPSEIAAGTRGASLGPAAIETAARKYHNTLFSEFPHSVVKDRNDALDLGLPPDGKAKYIDEYTEVFKNLESEVCRLLKNGKFPLVLSGDHSSGAATISGCKLAKPNQKLGVVWIDAHADIHSPYTTPSGNIHGMPLAIATGIDNLDCKINEPSEKTIADWNALKNSGDIQPKISTDNLIFCGVRDTEQPEDYLLEKHSIKNFKVQEFRQSSAKKIGQEVLARLADCDWIYVSFDVDGMDPDETSYGTGTPVKNGLHPQEAKDLIETLLASGKVGCFEIVEVNPCLDNLCNKMAEVTFDILENSVKVLTK